MSWSLFSGWAPILPHRDAISEVAEASKYLAGFIAIQDDHSLVYSNHFALVDRYKGACAVCELRSGMLVAAAILTQQSNAAGYIFTTMAERGIEATVKGTGRPNDPFEQHGGPRWFADAYQDT